MKVLVSVVCWVGVVVVAVLLRFDDLAARPFHCDEATGARLTAKRMEAGDYRFDPLHFHGPTLGWLAGAWCKARGEGRWREMTKGTLRVVPAVAGTLLVLVPLLGRRRWGDASMLLAAALFATSPLLVYYSRMFIHESLLALFGILALFAFCGKRRWTWMAAGLFVGLMFATKESFAISVIAWSGAGLLLAVENRKELLERFPGAGGTAAVPGPVLLTRVWREWRVPVAGFFLTAMIAAGFLYTDGFRHPRGAIDAVRTFFIYQTTGGHEKPFPYYLHFLLWPKQAAGVWWGETPVAVLAVLAYGSTFLRSNRQAPWRPFARFLAYASAGHFLIYSLIAYKTPWLACLPWAHVCLLAGFAVAGFASARREWKAACVVFIVLTLAWQWTRAKHAVGRLAADARNPYAYVPTRRDIEVVERWLRELREVAAREPAIPFEPVAVVGSGYWPLPWYLRDFQAIGYLPEVTPDLDRFPLVFVVPESLDAAQGRLGQTHTPVPRGLREDVPVTIFLRKDLWERWMNG